MDKYKTISVNMKSSQVSAISDLKVYLIETRVGKGIICFCHNIFNHSSFHVLLHLKELYMLKESKLTSQRDTSCLPHLDSAI